MALIYITGMSGTGKSAVCQELTKRGYQAYEVDDFPDTGGSKLVRARVKQLNRGSENPPTFLCGVKPRSEEAAKILYPVNWG